MTLYTLVTSFVGSPTVVTDIPTLITYTIACAIFVLLIFTVPYIITVIISIFRP